MLKKIKKINYKKRKRNKKRIKCLGYTGHKCGKEFKRGRGRNPRKRCPECRYHRHLEMERKFRKSHPWKPKSRAKHYNKAEKPKQVRTKKTAYNRHTLQTEPAEKFAKTVNQILKGEIILA